MCITLPDSKQVGHMIYAKPKLPSISPTNEPDIYQSLADPSIRLCIVNPPLNGLVSTERRLPAPFHRLSGLLTILNTRFSSVCSYEVQTICAVKKVRKFAYVKLYLKFI